MVICFVMLGTALGCSAANIALVNPDYLRVVKLGVLMGECQNSQYYYSLAYGVVGDRPCEDFGNKACWESVGVQDDFIGAILESAGNSVSYYTSATFRNITATDFPVVVVQDPLTDYGVKYPESAADSLPDFLGDVASSGFVNALSDYIASGGVVILVGDAVRLLGDPPPGKYTLGYGDTISTLSVRNSQSNPSDCVPSKWLFERGNPFCCLNRVANATYTIADTSLPIGSVGTKLADLTMLDSVDLPDAYVWSDTAYYPSDGVSLLDVRVQGTGEYVLRGDVCSPPVYTDSVDATVLSFMGYVVEEGHRIYYLASDTYFDYHFQRKAGQWHCPGQSAEMNFVTTDVGKRAIEQLVLHALGWKASQNPSGAPEMQVQGGSSLVSILDGDTTPSTADGTDFGATLVAGTTVDHTFTIKNTGTADLNLTGTPMVQVTGTDTADFTATMQPDSVVAPGNSTTFVIRFDPSAAGTRSATVSITSNSADSPYTFAIQGAGVDKGDVNADGVANILDVRLCLQIARGVIEGTPGQRQRADVNGDGAVTLTDAQLLTDYVLGISH